MAEVIYEGLAFRGEPLVLTDEDITVHRMREFKATFGDGYGTLPGLMSKLAGGDMDALACVIAIHGQKTGKPIGDLMTFEFAWSDISVVEKPKRAPKASRASKTTATADATSSSETSTNSEDDSSSS